MSRHEGIEISWVFRNHKGESLFGPSEREIKRGEAWIEPSEKEVMKERVLIEPPELEVMKGEALWLSDRTIGSRVLKGEALIEPSETEVMKGESLVDNMYIIHWQVMVKVELELIRVWLKRTLTEKDFLYKNH